MQKHVFSIPLLRLDLPSLLIAMGDTGMARPHGGDVAVMVTRWRRRSHGGGRRHRSRRGMVAPSQSWWHNGLRGPESESPSVLDRDEGHRDGQAARRRHHSRVGATGRVELEPLGGWGGKV
jgi:hypothetical protein